jgi:hypothetical protein
VSHSYELGRGWTPSYPETTGYIIPTLLHWAAHRGSAEARRRALEMADWEIAIQLPSGGIQGSVIGRTTPAVVFNTGQVVFGWLAAYEETREPRYLEAAARAVGWLARTLGDGETWTSHGNMGEARAHAYNARVSWAVLAFLRLRPDAAVEAAMRRTLDWVLARERAPGWFERNCLTDEARPLLHTIAYTAQGLLESGVLLGDARLVDAAQRTADALLAARDRSGRLAGRYDRAFRRTVRWSCLTGVAQTAIIWHRLHTLTGREEYAGAASASGRYLRSVQDVDTDHPGVRGAFAGSHPVWGGYCAYRYPNWAAKFALDAFLLETGSRAGDRYPG